MMHGGLDHGPYEGDAEHLPAEDQALLDTLASRLSQPDRQGLSLSAAAATALDAAIPAEPLPAPLRAQLKRVALEAEATLEFDAHLGHMRSGASLALYVKFLRQRSGLSATEAASRFKVDLKWLTALERNLLGPKQIPAPKLATILHALHGSLALAEELLTTTIRAPRWLPSGGRDSLFRGGSGAQGVRTSPPDPERENPEYIEEVTAVQELRGALRRSWRG